MAALPPSDHVFDGGDLDCGSGLALLIRQHMHEVPPGGVLEVRSREGTVRDDLPPWCRMTGHEYLGERVGDDGAVHYFMRRGVDAPEDDAALEDDLARANDFEWRVRARSTGPLRSKAYFRNLSLEVGQPASFEERDEHASAIEVLLTALATSISSGFANACRQKGLDVDDVEVTVTGRLRDVQVVMGITDDGDAGLSEVTLKCFASSMDDEDALRACFDDAVKRSPVAATLSRACTMSMRLAVV